MSAEDRLKQLGLVLPQVPSPVANYVSYRIAGNVLYLAGQGPRGADGAQLTGKVGAEISVDEGYRRGVLERVCEVLILLQAGKTVAIGIG